MNEIDKARLEVMDGVIELFDDFGTGGDDDWAYRKNAIEMLEYHKEKMLNEINAREASLFEWDVREVKHSGGTGLSIHCKVNGEPVASGHSFRGDVGKYCMWLGGSANLYIFDTLDEAKAWVETQSGGAK